MQLENKEGRHRQRRSREEVKRLVDEFEANGSDRAEFCRPWGEHPNGYLSYFRDGRMSAILVAEDRPSVAPLNAQEKVQLLECVAAYAGTYTAYGEKVAQASA